MVNQCGLRRCQAASFAILDHDNSPIITHNNSANNCDQTYTIAMCEDERQRLQRKKTMPSLPPLSTAPAAAAEVALATASSDAASPIATPPSPTSPVKRSRDAKTDAAYTAVKRLASRIILRKDRQGASAHGSLFIALDCQHFHSAILTI
jgi:hypothetical protein